METISNSLLDFGALGVMVAGLFWMNQNLQKRQDALSKKFADQIEEQEKVHRESEDRIRDRYDEVIKRYELRLSEVQSTIVDLLKENTSALSTIQEKISDLQD